MAVPRSLGDRNDADPDSEAEWHVDPMAWLTDVLQRIVSGRTKIPRTEHPTAVELDPAHPANDHGTRCVAAADKSPQPVKSNLPRRRRDAYRSLDRPVRQHC